MSDAAFYGLGAGFFAGALFTGFAGASHCFAAGFDEAVKSSAMRSHGTGYLFVTPVLFGFAVAALFSGLGG